jgi:hypothetical protein
MESALNAAGIFKIEQFVQSSFAEIYSKLKDKIPQARLEFWVAEAEKIQTKQKIVLLTKDMNLKKLFRKKP